MWVSVMSHAKVKSRCLYKLFIRDKKAKKKFPKKWNLKLSIFIIWGTIRETCQIF